MNQRANLTQRSVDAPADRWCSSGHYTPDGIRFFSVSGDALDRSRWGIYCEACLATANKLAAKRRQRKQDETMDFDKFTEFEF